MKITVTAAEYRLLISVLVWAENWEVFLADAPRDKLRILRDKLLRSKADASSEAERERAEKAEEL